MKPISNTGELKEAIAELERRKSAQQLVIKDQFALAKEAAKPANVIRNGFSRLAEIPEVRRTMINTLIGFGLGYFSRKATRLLSEQSMNHMVSNFVDFTADHIIERDPQGFLAKGVHLARNAMKENVVNKP